MCKKRAFIWRGVVSKMNYFDILDWFPLSPEKNFLQTVQRERVFCTTFILINNLPLQNELTFAS